MGKIFKIIGGVVLGLLGAGVAASGIKEFKKDDDSDMIETTANEVQDDDDSIEDETTEESTEKTSMDEV